MKLNCSKPSYDWLKTHRLYGSLGALTRDDVDPDKRIVVSNSGKFFAGIGKSDVVPRPDDLVVRIGAEDRVVFRNSGDVSIDTTTILSDLPFGREIAFKTASLAIVSGSDSVLRTTDGFATTTTVALPATLGSGSRIAYSPDLDMFLTGSASSAVSAYSTDDGVSWTEGAFPAGIVSLVWSAYLQKFVALRGGTLSAREVFLSADGINWDAYGNSVLGTDPADWQYVRSIDEKGLLVVTSMAASTAAQTAGQVALSSDGMTWTRKQITPLANYGCSPAVYDSRSGLITVTTSNATVKFDGSESEFAAVTHGAGFGAVLLVYDETFEGFVNVSLFGSMSYSKDALTWSSHTIPATSPGSLMFSKEAGKTFLLAINDRIDIVTGTG